MSWLILNGDARQIPLKDESVHMVCCSPPFFNLRDYQTGTWQGGLSECDHVQKEARNDVSPEALARRASQYGTGTQAGSLVSPMQYRASCPKCGALRIDKQIGLESTVREYLAEMVAVFREVWRVLRKDGTVWCEIGDSFQDKQLLGVPWKFALALQEDGWILRSDIIWHHVNCMPESVTSRPTKSHSYIFLLTKSAKYYYDAEAIREPHKAASLRRVQAGLTTDRQRNYPGAPQTLRMGDDQQMCHPSGRNKRSVWTIPTAPSSLAHFASFPPEIPRLCILAGTSEKGCCPHCLAPWIRVTKRRFLPQTDVRDPNKLIKASNKGLDESNGWGETPRGTVESVTLGWQPTCDCPPHKPVPCRVLDIFGGTGTTAIVSDRLGRHGISLDLSREYSAMAHKRVFNDAPLFAELTTPPVTPAVQAGLFEEIV